MGKRPTILSLEAGREKMIRNAWFKDNVATLATFTASDGRTIEELHWAKPGRFEYSVRYVTDGHALMIYGDIGEAVHRIYQESSLRWWSKISLDYFVSKCCAGETGKDSAVWDAEHARVVVRGLIADAGRNAARVFRDENGDYALDSQHDWREWLSNHGGDVFGDYFYEHFDAGMRVSTRCQAHLIGLKMAFAQLDACANPAVHETALSPITP